MHSSSWAQQPCIMFVDGNDDLRGWVKGFLEREGLKVLLASNSVEALVLAADYPFPIDVLVTDAEMRVYQNGVELAECFRVLRPETRIVLATDAPSDSAPEWERIPRDFKRGQLLNALRLRLDADSEAGGHLPYSYRIEYSA